MVSEPLARSWPARVPWRGFALAGSAAVVLFLIVIPAYRIRYAPAKGTMELARINAQANQGLARSGVEAKPLADRDQSAPMQLAQSPVAQDDWRSAHHEAAVSGVQKMAAMDSLAAARAVPSAESLAASVSTTETLPASTIAGGRLTMSQIGAQAAGAGAPQSADAAATVSEAISASELRDDGRSAEEAAPNEPGPAPAEATPEPRAGALQVRWPVSDLAGASAQVQAWVAARGGWSVATNEHHLAVTIPAADAPEFLKQFSAPTAPSEQVPTSAAAPAGTGWVTISLELVPAS
jgi:hypothetical protein